MTLKKLKASLDASGELQFEEVPAIISGENLSAELTVKCPDFLQGQSTRYYFEFKCADGKRYVTPPITPVDDCLSYELENCVLSGCGNVQVQVVATNGEAVFKSRTAEFPVMSAVNAKTQTYFRKDFWSAAQTLLDDLQSGKTTLNQLVEQVSALIEQGDFKGDKGEKGDKGDPGFATWGTDGVSQSNVIWQVFS